MIKYINYLKIGVLVILFFLLFIKFQYLPFVIVLLLFLSIVTINYKTLNYKELKPILPILFFFSANVFSLLYSENFNNGFSTIQTQFSLLLIPIIVIIDKQFYFHNKKNISDLYILISFISIFFLSYLFISSGGLGKILETYKRIDFFILIRYFKLSAGQHPSYISMGYLFSVVLILHSFKKSKNILMVIIKVIAISILLVFIFFLNSRAIMLSIIMVSIYYTLKYLVEHKWIYKIIVLSIFIIGFVFLLNNSRFKQVFQKVNTATSIEQVDLRLSLWIDAIIVWKEKPILGHGIGDSKDAIIEVHKQRNISEAIEYKYNAHNQYLETAMQTGLVGLIALILVFVVPLYQSIKKKQELLFLFLMICLINFMFESMLQRVSGVVFFSFWYSFLWFVYYKPDTNELN